MLYDTMVDSPDPVVEVYKRDIDRSLLRANRQLTVGERIVKLQRLHEFIVELQRAGREAKGKP